TAVGGTLWSPPVHASMDEGKVVRADFNDDSSRGRVYILDAEGDVFELHGSGVGDHVDIAPPRRRRRVRMPRSPSNGPWSPPRRGCLRGPHSLRTAGGSPRCRCLRPYRLRRIFGRVVGVDIGAGRSRRGGADGSSGAAEVSTADTSR